MTVSVIMTVYNGGAYLRAMLDSLLFQIRKPDEIICVDDGSGDGSMQILEEYAGRYPFIHPYRIENSGAAAARCFGFSKSSGEAVCFADCDDQVDPDYISSLLEALEQKEADVAVGGYAREREDGSLISCEMMEQKRTDIAPWEEEALWINTALWNKMFRRSVIPEDIILPRIKQGDDLAYWCRILPQVRRITFVPKPMYHYIVHGTGQMAAFSRESFEWMTEEFIETAKGLQGQPVFDTVTGCYFISLCVAQLPRYYETDPAAGKAAAKELADRFDRELPGWRKAQGFRLSAGFRGKFKGLAFWGCGFLFRRRWFIVHQRGMNFIKKLGLHIGW